MINKIYDKINQFIKDNYKGIITLLVIFLIFMVELPYRVYTPGGAVNLNDRITIDDGYEPDGSFNMAYVSMVRGSIPFLLISKIIPDWDIVKKDDITIEGENIDEMIARERLYMQESLDNATINAYQKAGKEINIKRINCVITHITEEADTDLKIGDIILNINGEEVSNIDELQAVITKNKAGNKVNIKIKREDKEKTAYAITYDTEDGVKIGVNILNTYDYDVNPNLEFKSKSSEMGSSGGLMMSLTIYNKLVAEDITKGKKIVGTGTIDINGNVGEIGGVKYKLIGAVKNKAEVFICPEENYEEAKKVAKDKKYKIKIISAKTFDEVLDSLAKL